MKGNEGPPGTPLDGDDILELLAATCPDPNAPALLGFCMWQIGDTAGPFTYQAAAVACAADRARLCTLAELSAAQAAGANSCAYTWLADRNDDSNAIAGMARQTPDAACCNKAGVCLVLTPMNGKHGATCCRP